MKQRKMKELAAYGFSRGEETRFGPNRPAAENGGVDFWVDLEGFIACFYLLPII